MSPKQASSEHLQRQAIPQVVHGVLWLLFQSDRLKHNSRYYLNPIPDYRQISIIVVL